MKAAMAKTKSREWEIVTLSMPKACHDSLK